MINQLKIRQKKKGESERRRGEEISDSAKIKEVINADKE